MKRRRQTRTLTCAAWHRQEAAAQLEQNDFGADDEDQPDASPRPSAPRTCEASAKMTRERRHGDGRAELVAREHRQQLVFELRLDRRSSRQARPPLLQVAVSAHACIAAVAAPRDVFWNGAGRHGFTRDGWGAHGRAMDVVSKSLQDFLTKCLVMKFSITPVATTRAKSRQMGIQALSHAWTAVRVRRCNPPSHDAHHHRPVPHF